MKTRELDNLIREALSSEDREFLDSLEEPTLPQQVTDLFSGRWRYLNALSMVVAVVMFIVCVYCTVEFLRADDVATQLRWGAGALFGMAATAYIKLWAWLELERNAVVREIKRLELQVAQVVAAGRGGA